MIKHRTRTRQEGQALVELGIVIVLIVTLAMGIIEFGRAFMVINMITNAAREGARSASVVSTSGRDSNGCLTGASRTSIDNLVLNQMQNVSDSKVTITTPPSSVCHACTGGIPTLKVTVSGRLNYLFGLPLFGSGFNFNRAITFGDEGRPTCNVACSPAC